MKILAIDPGKTVGAVLFERGEVKKMTETEDYRILSRGEWIYLLDAVCIETIAPYSQQLQQDVIDTCIQIGGMIERFRSESVPVYLVTRQEVKRHLFGVSTGKDSEVRRAVIERLGEVGTKKSPGPCFGMKGHIYAAAAVAILASDQLDGDKGEGKKFAQAFEGNNNGKFAASSGAGAGS